MVWPIIFGVVGAALVSKLASKPASTCTYSTHPSAEDQMESAKRDLVCKEVSIGLRVFLDGCGIPKSDDLSQRITPAKITRELEDDTFKERCVVRFMETDSMRELTKDMRRQKKIMNRIQKARAELGMLSIDDA